MRFALPVLALWLLPALAQAQPASPIPAQAEAMQALSWMDGRFQGPAWSATPSGRHDIIQTERVGPMLDGSLKVIEGKSFEPDGRPSNFNAFGVISYDPRTKAYTLHSYAQGRAGDFPLEVTPQGYAWKIAAGPVTIRYTATRQGDGWREIGEMVRPDGSVTQIFEMNLHRLGNTDWPLAGQATAPKP
jgi:hypothetical protein